MCPVSLQSGGGGHQSIATVCHTVHDRRHPIHHPALPDSMCPYSHTAHPGSLCRAPHRKQAALGGYGRGNCTFVVAICAPRVTPDVRRMPTLTPREQELEYSYLRRLVGIFHYRRPVPTTSPKNRANLVITVAAGRLHRELRAHALRGQNSLALYLHDRVLCFELELPTLV